MACASAVMVAASTALCSPAAALPCVGDCGLDGQVTVDEIVVGVGIALGQQSVEACPAFDRDGDGQVTVDELLAAVGVALSGCTVNRPPGTVTVPAYRTYPGQQVRFPIPATDLDGDRLRFDSRQLPPGATLDRDTGVLSWVPAQGDVGVHVIEYTVTDNGVPPLSTSGKIELRVGVLEPCIEIECDPVLGCTEMPVEVGTNCCTREPPTRQVLPLEDCPAGAVIAVGRNAEGFGPMRNCDELPVVSVGQGGTRVTMHVAARCIDFAERAQLRIQMFNQDFVLVNRTARINFRPVDNGYAAAFNLVSEVDDSQFEPFLLEGAEQQLYVSVQDAHGFLVERTLRVRTTLRTRQDLPDDGTSPVLPPNAAVQRLPLLPLAGGGVAEAVSWGNARSVKAQ